VIKVFDLCWEPWYLRCSYYGNFGLHLLQLINGFIDILIIYLSVKISKKVDCALMINHFGWPRLNPREVNPIFSESIQCLLQNARFVI
jgi:hypothetical protein